MLTPPHAIGYKRAHMNLTPFARWHGPGPQGFRTPVPKTTAGRVALRLHLRRCANSAGLFTPPCVTSLGLKVGSARVATETDEAEGALFWTRAWCKGIPGFGPGGAGAIPAAGCFWLPDFGSLAGSLPGDCSSPGSFHAPDLFFVPGLAWCLLSDAKSRSSARVHNFTPIAGV